MTFAELKKNIRKAKEVYIEANLTSHDPYAIQVKKKDLLWTIQHYIEPHYKPLVKRGEAEINASWYDDRFYFYGVYDA